MFSSRIAYVLGTYCKNVSFTCTKHVIIEKKQGKKNWGGGGGGVNIFMSTCPHNNSN